MVNQSTPLRTIATLTLLLLLFPFTAFVTLISLVWNSITNRFHSALSSQSNRKTVLLTGGKMTKALQLARSFHAAGHRVILVETHKYWLIGNRFSNAIDRFYTVASPQNNIEQYTQELLHIIQQEEVDIFIPVASAAGSYSDSLAKPALSKHCEVFHFDAEITQRLDDKFTFAEQARSLGLTVPKSFYITDPQQILDFDFSQESRTFIVKSIRYNSVYRLDLTQLPCSTRAETEAFVSKLPISKDNPWIMQEFVQGKEYCTHSTVRNGEVRLYCCCESSAFQVNYENVDRPAIREWVQTFVRDMNLTGQISFDFIETETGDVYAIECNPRTHSAITTFYNHPGVADAYLDPAPQSTTLEPLPTSKPTYWLYHELWRLVTARSLTEFLHRIAIIRRGKDAVFRVNDPLPFLMVHHWHIPLLLLDNLRRRGGWVRIDFNIGKLVELGGD